MTPTVRRPARACLAAVLATIALAPVQSAVAEESPGPGAEDSSLRQRIEPDQQVASGRAELDGGHVDIGPRYAGERWALMVHDDSDRQGSVWRSPDEVVLRVTDAALQTVPDDPAYRFLGSPAGQRVHVIPQTQQEGVVWVGWNTQEPSVLASVDRGATLTLEGVQGPGDLVVYLQNGAFGEPDVLWDSRETGAQELFVDVNTHTHANWVFTAPGVYLVRIRASADLVDRSSVADTRVLRFAVGDATRSADALAARFADAVPQAAQRPVARTSDEDPSTPGWFVAVTVGAVILVCLFVASAVRARRTRLAARDGRGS